MLCPGQNFCSGGTADKSPCTAAGLSLSSCVVFVFFVCVIVRKKTVARESVSIYFLDCLSLHLAVSPRRTRRDSLLLLSAGFSGGGWGSLPGWFMVRSRHCIAEQVHLCFGLCVSGRCEFGRRNHMTARCLIFIICKDCNCC